MDCIADCICIDGLESCINGSADELWVIEVIISSHQVLKAGLVATNCEGVDFGGFVWPYNILTLIQQRLKSEETLVELVKHKKGLGRLNMYEDTLLTVLTFNIIALYLFGGKRSTESEIWPLTDYTKWRNKSLHEVLGYYI